MMKYTHLKAMQNKSLDEAGYPPCYGDLWDGECSDECIEQHKIYCSICKKPLKINDELFACSIFNNGKDLRDSGTIIDRDEEICTWCALRLGKVAV